MPTPLGASAAVLHTFRPNQIPNTFMPRFDLRIKHYYVRPGTSDWPVFRATRELRGDETFRGVRLTNVKTRHDHSESVASQDGGTNCV